jgi:hypothetical protein
MNHVILICSLRCETDHAESEDVILGSVAITIMEVDTAIIEVVGKVVEDLDAMAVKISVDTPATISMASNVVNIVIADNSTTPSVSDIDAANIIHQVETDVMDVVLFNDKVEGLILAPNVDTIPEEIGNIVV